MRNRIVTEMSGMGEGREQAARWEAEMAVHKIYDLRFTTGTVEGTGADNLLRDWQQPAATLKFFGAGGQQMVAIRSNHWLFEGFGG